MGRHWSPLGLYCKFFDKYPRPFLAVNSPFPGLLRACILVSRLSTTIMVFIKSGKGLNFVRFFVVRGRRCALMVSTGQGPCVVVLYLSPSRCIKGYRWTGWGNLTNCCSADRGSPVVGLDSTQGDVAIPPDWDKLLRGSVSSKNNLYVTLLYRHHWKNTHEATSRTRMAYFVVFWWRHFLHFHGCLCKRSVCLYNERKVTRWLRNMNFIPLATSVLTTFWRHLWSLTEQTHTGIWNLFVDSIKKHLILFVWKRDLSQHFEM